MAGLQTLLHDSAAQHHNHLCPRQVLGVRMGLYAAELMQLDMPQSNKRVFVFAEMDGCLLDGITAATGCSVGHRTMRVLDYGKTAATFVDTERESAIRLAAAPSARTRALLYAPSAPNRWHAQLAAYQVMPNDELWLAQPVVLTISLKKIIGRHGQREVCDSCGEDIINQREVHVDGRILCRACALGSYYEPADSLLAPVMPTGGIVLPDLAPNRC